MGWAEKRIQEYKEGQQVNFLERLEFSFAHPVSLVLTILGFVVLVYGLWTHSWGWIISGILLFVIGYQYVYHTDWVKKKIESYRQGREATWLEKRVLEHANPVHWVLAVIGLIVIIYGLWTHAFLLIIFGIVFNIIGHVYTWIYEK